MKLAKVSVAALDRHAFTLDDVPGEGLRHLIVGAMQTALVAIQVTHFLLVAEECLLERDVEIHVEVVLNALEHVMRLLL